MIFNVLFLYTCKLIIYFYFYSLKFKSCCNGQYYFRFDEYWKVFSWLYMYRNPVLWKHQGIDMNVYKILTVTLKIFGGIFISLHHEPPNNNSLYTALGESVLILTDGQFQQSEIYQCKKLLHKHRDVSILLESNHV